MDPGFFKERRPEGPPRKKEENFEPYIYINIYISEMKVASIMTQSRGHIMYSGRVLNTSLSYNGVRKNLRNTRIPSTYRNHLKSFVL